MNKSRMHHPRKHSMAASNGVELKTKTVIHRTAKTMTTEHGSFSQQTQETKKKTGRSQPQDKYCTMQFLQFPRMKVNEMILFLYYHAVSNRTDICGSLHCIEALSPHVFQTIFLQSFQRFKNDPLVMKYLHRLE